ncbi:GGDEF and EAL domain-containing protein [Salirhabdus sp. Marseille-P4669]|uniref:GGDEF and EAL domain-containing protein n=1 Tax=Salirhabdus sp. Marseille-P4669 TaxID=2042310 RepID=UPI000C7A8402|nr:GGDEF and EAL domain-containing protein [Salirhabdus sp. Marseille-P4669]
MDIVTNKENFPIPKSFLTHLRDAVIITESNGYITYGNKSAYQLLNLEHNQTTKQSIVPFVDFEFISSKSEYQTLHELPTNQRPLVDIKSWKMEDGNFCFVLHPIRLNDERESMLYSMSNMMHASHEGMLLHDGNRIIDCDPSFAKMLGFPRAELLNQPIHSIFDIASCVQLESNKGEEQSNSFFQLTGTKQDGDTIYVEVFSQAYPNENQSLQIAIIRDITEGVLNKKKIEFMAYYDELTDLPNRNYFNKTLVDAIEECKENQSKLAVHFVDIDYFKQINDSLGYQFGDNLLKACANRLKSLLNEFNFIARMSGDEFLILQRGIQDEEDAKQFAKKVIAAFTTPIKVNEFEIYTSVSIGISLYPENGTNSNELIKHADSAMYVIKEKQRNHFQLFESSISENFKEMLTIENELRRAIQDKQFELHYQPQVNIHTDEVIGFEALLRWKHPSKGYISPGVFIPLAEKTGLIIEIGDWVLQEACRQNKEWQNRGYKPTKISVNLSVKQFLQKNLVEKVEQTLHDTGLKPDYLELEITESMAMANEEFILATLRGLQNLGVQVAIDDFGTGYSSMKYLSQFPLSKLKIDQLFIRGDREQNQAIVKSIIHLSHALNMKVIAEGVETKEQLEFLRNESCDEIQGFYFSKPVAPKEAESFFVR